MAILGLFTGNSITKQMCEDARKEVDWEHKHPAGLIFHAAGFDDSGNNMHVADIWESKQDLNNFACFWNGLTYLCQRQIFPIHNNFSLC